jgi:hypothetical protein
MNFKDDLAIGAVFGIKMRGTLSSFFLALALTTGIARADVITTYTLSNVATEDLGTVTGSFKIDQTTYNYNTEAGFVSGSVVVSGDFLSNLNGTYSFHEYDGNSALFTSPNDSLLFLTIDRPGPLLPPGRSTRSLALAVTLTSFLEEPLPR